MSLTLEQKHKTISATVTVVVVCLALLVCAFVGLNPPDPPIPEEGVEVNLGDSDYGLGDVPTPHESENMRPPSQPASAGEHVSTQHTEQTVSMNTSDNQATRQAEQPTTQPQPEAPTQPQLNPNALFRGNKSSETGGSQGVSSGTGNQGKAGGNPNSQRYDGVAGNGGSGWSLSGRRASAFPLPDYDANKEGKIIVKIWVDPSGHVVRVEAPEKGSTITNAGMVAKAKAAAMNARFNSDDKAPELQIGTITYVFRRNN